MLPLAVLRAYGCVWGSLLVVLEESYDARTEQGQLHARHAPALCCLSSPTSFVLKYTYFSLSDSVWGDQRHSIVGRVLALHAATPNLILDTTYGPPKSARE